MSLLGQWKFAGQPQTNLVADQVGSMDITHAGGSGAGWWRDSPDYALAGDNANWSFTADLANRPDPTSHTDLSFCFAIKARPSPRTSTGIFSFYGSSAGGFKGWGIALNMSYGSIHCIDSAALWNGTSWQTFPNTNNVFPSVADQRLNYYGVVINMTQGGNAEAFIDGQSLGTVATGTFAHDTTAGTQAWGRDYSYIDNIQYHDRLLTATEIQTHAYGPRTWEPSAGLGDEKLWLCPSINNSPNDISGNGNNGVYQNGMGTISDVSNGGSLAYDFDGIADYIDVTSSGVPAAAYTVSLWQYSTTSVNNTAFNAGDTSGNRTVNIAGVKAGQSGDNHGHKSGGTSYWVSNPTVRTSATWYHYLLTYDGSELKLYVDGVYIANLTGVPNTNWTESRCRVGQYIGSGFFFRGRIDDIRTYDRALTQAEITHLASQRGIEGPAPVGLGDEQLWWSPSLSQSVTLDSSAYGKTVSSVGTAPTLIADTDAGGQYAGQFSTAGSTRVEDQFAFLSTGDFSMCGWIKSATSARMVFGGQQAGGSDSNKSGGMVDQNSGVARARFRSGVSDSNDLLTTTTPVPDNTWHHVTATRSGSDCKVYVNGVLAGTKTISGYPSAPDLKDLLIGGLWNGSTTLNLSTGYMDDIRVFTRALTQAEITHLATSRGIEGPAPVGLGGETCWICPTLTQDSTQDITGSGLAITTTGSVTVTTDTGAGGTHANFCQGDGIGGAGQEVIIDNFGNTYAEATSVSWWSRRTAGGNVIEMGGGTNNWPTVVGGRFFYQYWYGADRGYMYNTSGGTNGWINETGSNATWKHHVMVREGVGGKNRLYINGVLDTEEHDDGGVETTGKDLYFGAGGGSSSDSELYMDDMRTYGRVLTQAEITHLATSRGIEGSPSTPTAQYNAFTTHAFTQLFQQRLR